MSKKKSADSAGFSMYGLVVNPRNAELIYCERDGDNAFNICTLADAVAGEGYFHSSKPTVWARYGESYQITGFPRVHTPEGVSAKGTGLGTVLYTAMCLAAHEHHIKMIKIPTLEGVGITGDGISSNEYRSREASGWWSAARTKYGLVEQVEGCATREGGFFKKVLTGSYKEKVCGLKADIYPYKNTSGLIVGMITRNDYELFGELSVAKVRFTPDAKKILASINTGVIQKYDQAQQKVAMDGVLALAQRAGVSVQDRKGMILRYSAGADPGTPGAEKGTRKNPDSGVAEELARVKKMRRSLGWSAFA